MDANYKKVTSITNNNKAVSNNKDTKIRGNSNVKKQSNVVKIKEDSSTNKNIPAKIESKF